NNLVDIVNYRSVTLHDIITSLRKNIPLSAGTKNCSSFFFAAEPPCPARGMPTLSAKDGFSRPSYLRSAGSHLGFISCWTSNTSTATHRTQKKCFSFLRSLHVFPSLR